MPDGFEVWVCRRCGATSRAQRRPPHHIRKVYIDEITVRRWDESTWPPSEHVLDELYVHDEGADDLSGFAVRCGPFDRYVARLDDPTPRPELPELTETARAKYQRDRARDAIAADPPAEPGGPDIPF